MKRKIILADIVQKTEKDESIQRKNGKSYMTEQAGVARCVEDN